MQNILPQLGDDVRLCMSLEYSDERDEAELRFRYNGSSFDPAKDGDELSMLLVKNAAKEIRHESINEEGYTNLVTVMLK